VRSNLVWLVRVVRSGLLGEECWDRVWEEGGVSSVCSYGGGEGLKGFGLQFWEGGPLRWLTLCFVLVLFLLEKKCKCISN